MRTFAKRAAVAALALLLAGCTNPFMPARPEMPTGSGVVEQFATREQLLSTIAAALTVRGASGQNAYKDAIADSTSAATLAFYAFHAPAAADAWHADTGLEPPTPWRRIEELKFYDYMAGLYSGYTYTFAWEKDNSSVIDDESEPLALLHRHYTLIASSADNAINKIIAVGYADLYMQKVGARWYLYRWEDRLDPSYGVRPTDPENLSMGARRLESIRSSH
jgi:hypothetical protein